MPRFAQASWIHLKIFVPALSADEPCFLEVPVNAEWYARWSRDRPTGTALVSIGSDDLRFDRQPPVASRLHLLSQSLEIDHDAAPLSLDVNASLQLTRDAEGVVEGNLVGGFVRARDLASTFSRSIAELAKLWNASGQGALAQILIGRARLQLQLSNETRVEHVRRVREQSSTSRVWQMVRSSAHDPAERLKVLQGEARTISERLGISVLPGASPGGIYFRVDDETGATTELVRAGFVVELPCAGGQRVRFAPRSLRVLSPTKMALVERDDVDDLLAASEPRSFAPPTGDATLTWRVGAPAANVSVERPFHLCSRASATPAGSRPPTIWQLARLTVTPGSTYDSLPASWVRYQPGAIPLTPTQVGSSEEPRLPAVSGAFELAIGENQHWKLSIEVPERAALVSRDARCTLILEDAGSNSSATLTLNGIRAHLDSPEVTLLDDEVRFPEYVTPARKIDSSLASNRLRFRTAESEADVPETSRRVLATVDDAKVTLECLRSSVAAYLPTRDPLIDPVSATGPNLLARPVIHTVLQEGLRGRWIKSDQIELDKELTSDPTGLWIQSETPEGTLRLIVHISEKKCLDLAVQSVTTAPPATNSTFRIGTLRLAVDRDPNHGLVRVELAAIKLAADDKITLNAKAVLGTEFLSAQALLPWAEWGPKPGSWLDRGRVLAHHRNLVLEHAELESSFADRFSPEEVAASGAMSVALPREATIRAVRDRFTAASGNIESGGRPLKNWLPGVHIEDGESGDRVHSHVRFSSGASPELRLDWLKTSGNIGTAVRGLARSLSVNATEQPAPWMTYGLHVRSLAVDAAPQVRLFTPAAALPAERRLATGSAAPLLFDPHAVAAVAAAGGITVGASSEPGGALKLVRGNSTTVESVPLASTDGTVRSVDVLEVGAATLGCAAVAASRPNQNGELELWDLTGTPSVAQRIVPPTDPARRNPIAARLVQVGASTLLVSGWDQPDAQGKAVYVWKTSTPATPDSKLAASGGVRCLDVCSTTSALLAWVDGHDAVTLVDLATGNAIALHATVQTSAPASIAVRVDPTGPQLALAADNIVSFWPRPTQPGVPVTWDLPSKVISIRFLQLPGLGHFSMADLAVLVVACADGCTRVFDLSKTYATGAIRQLTVPAGSLTAVWVSPGAPTARSYRALVATSAGQVFEMNLNSGEIRDSAISFVPDATLDNLGVIRTRNRGAGADLSTPTATANRDLFKTLTMSSAVLTRDADTVLQDRTEILISCESLRVSEAGGALPDVDAMALFNSGTYAVHSTIRAPADSSLAFANHWPRLAGIPFYVTRLLQLDVQIDGSLNAQFDAVLLSPAEVATDERHPDDLGHPDVVRRALASGSILRITIASGAISIGSIENGKPLRMIWEVPLSNQDQRRGSEHVDGKLARLVGVLVYNPSPTGNGRKQLCLQPTPADCRVLAFGRLWPVGKAPAACWLGGTFEGTGNNVLQKSLSLTGDPVAGTKLKVDVEGRVRTVVAELPVKLATTSGGWALEAKLTERFDLELTVKKGGKHDAVFIQQQGPYWCYVLDPDDRDRTAGAAACVIWRRGDLNALPIDPSPDPDKGLDLIVVHEAHEAIRAKLGAQRLDGVQHKLSISFPFRGEWWVKTVWTTSVFDPSTDSPERWLTLEGECLKRETEPAVPVSITGFLSWDRFQGPVRVENVDPSTGLNHTAVHDLKIEDWTYQVRSVERTIPADTADVVTGIAGTPDTIHEVRVSIPKSNAGPETYARLVFDGSNPRLFNVDRDRVPVEPYLDEQSLGRMPRVPRTRATLDHRSLLGTSLRYASLSKDALLPHNQSSPTEPHLQLRALDEHDKRFVVMTEDVWLHAKRTRTSPRISSECVLVLNRPPTSPDKADAPDGDAFVSIGAQTRPRQNAAPPEPPVEFAARIGALASKTGAAGVILVRQLDDAKPGLYRFVDSPFFSENTHRLADARITHVEPLAAAVSAPADRLDGRLVRPDQVGRWEPAPSARGEYRPVVPRAPQDDPDCCLPNRQLAFERPTGANLSSEAGLLPQLHLFEATAFRDRPALTHLPEKGRIQAVQHAFFLPPTVDIRYASDKPGAMMHHLLQARVARDTGNGWTYACEPPLDVALRDPLQVRKMKCVSAAVTIKSAEVVVMPPSEAPEHLGLATAKITWEELLGRVTPRDTAMAPQNFEVKLAGERLELRVNNKPGTPLDVVVQFNQEFFAVADREQAVPGYEVQGANEKFLLFPKTWLYSKLADIAVDRPVMGGDGTVRPFVLLDHRAQAEFIVEDAPSGGKRLGETVLDLPFDPTDKFRYMRLVVDGADLGTRFIATRRDRNRYSLKFYLESVSDGTNPGYTWTDPRNSSVSGTITAVNIGSPAVVTFGGTQPTNNMRIKIEPANQGLSGEWTAVDIGGGQYELLGDQPINASTSPARLEWGLLAPLSEMFDGVGDLRPARFEQLKITGRDKPDLNIVWAGAVRASSAQPATWRFARAFSIDKRWVFHEIGTLVPKLAAVLKLPALKHHKTIWFGDGAPPDKGRIDIDRGDLVFKIDDLSETVTVPLPKLSVDQVGKPVHVVLLKYLLGGPVVMHELPPITVTK